MYLVSVALQGNAVHIFSYIRSHHLKSSAKQTRSLKQLRCLVLCLCQRNIRFRRFLAAVM